ncbi:MAG: pyridoxamine 5'-phosphate oxidase family protein [Candidatus Syntrophosphaera sp.]|nr:pyridoxamine 5'-phosphate oxidase family protein [Candidatus Syntrophosphaera sp.]
MEERIIALLKPTQMVHLATCESGQPRLRPMTMIYLDGSFYFATGAADSKCAQIAANHRAEFCLLLKKETNSGYLRGSGMLRQVDDLGLRKEVADFAPFLLDYWQGPADPAFRLFVMDLKQLRYMKPGDDYEVVTDH